MAQWLELKVTVGNIITTAVLLGGVIVSWAQTQDALASLNKKTDQIPTLADVVAKHTLEISNLEYRADTGKAARESLEQDVKDQQKQLTQILQALTRIETTLGSHDNGNRFSPIN